MYVASGSSVLSYTNTKKHWQQQAREVYVTLLKLKE